MANFTIKINGLDSLIKNIKVGGEEMQRDLKDAMVESTTMVQNEARRIKSGRFKNRTGNLRRNINRTVESYKRGIVYVSELYGLFVEKGTRPHVILPKRAKMLYFKVAGKPVFAKKVNHPGSKPYPYMQPAFEDSVPKIEQVYDRLVNKYLKTLSK